MYTLLAGRTIDAPVGTIWKVISDIEGYGDYAPNLSKATRTSDGKTPSRRCTDTQGRSWNEACVLWEEGTVYSYIVDTTDYPYPFDLLKGTWGLEPVHDGVRVFMKFDYILNKPWPVSWLLNHALRQQFMPILDKLLDNWETAIHQQSQIEK